MLKKDMNTTQLQEIANYYRNNIEDFALRYDLALDLAWEHHTSIEIEDSALYERMCELAEEWGEDNDTEIEDTFAVVEEVLDIL